MTKTESLVAVDARNRALRTFLQNIGFDIAAALVVVLYTVIAPAESWGDIQWAVLGFTLVKTASVTGLSYLMRKVFDRTTLVPDGVTPPAESGE